MKKVTQIRDKNESTAKMQIQANKYIILTILLLVSVALSAQIGKRKYVTRSGDTTVVVMAGSTGLYGEDAKFLLDPRASEDFLEKRSRYNRLKDAILETEQVAVVVDEEQRGNNPTAGSLGFRIAQQNVRYLQKSQEAEQVVRNNRIDNRASVAEIAYMKEKFGDKPSFFINGVSVDAGTASRVPRNAVLSREFKTSNTSTGNPNGEVWMVINSRAFDRLNLDVSYAENAISKQQEISSDYSSVVEDVDLRKEEFQPEGLTSEQEERLKQQEREIEDLKKAISNFGGAASPSTERRVVTARDGNRFLDPKEEIFSFRDSPQERSRRDRDKQGGSNSNSSQGSRTEEVLQVTNQAEKDGFVDPDITDDTPKRSVRRIKERQRNQ